MSTPTKKRKIPSPSETPRKKSKQALTPEAEPESPSSRKSGSSRRKEKVARKDIGLGSPLKDKPSSSAPRDGVGLSNPELGEERRHMFDIISKLKKTGVQVDIDLPQIAVIGSQSAGKSSLIESISGITLPRAPGTCTRCPTECKLSQKESPWQCIVSIVWYTDTKGYPMSERFGPIILDKAQVEDRIRRAQLAILNPKLPAKDFLESDIDTRTTRAGQLTFSLNAVSLEISGPEVADLSFCDLPGLIASVSSGRGGNNDVALVEALITEYIKKPSCIILLAVACETDFENQGAHRLAKEHDPEGKRTVGVLTKPDRIPPGEESNWLPFILNEKDMLDNHWFCVKQPASNDLASKVTWEKARKKEKSFFSANEPWCRLEPIYQKYLGTPNLVDKLSSLLSSLIFNRIPQIMDELTMKILTTRDELAHLPPAPPEDPHGAVILLFHGFSEHLNQDIEGIKTTNFSLTANNNATSLLQKIRPLLERFKKAIRDTVPKFRPFESSEAGTKHLSPAYFLRGEDDYIPDGEASDSEDEEPLTSSDESTPSANNRMNRKRPTSNIIYIDEVLKKANDARTRELPGHYPNIVQLEYIYFIINKWSGPVHVVCRLVHGAICQHVDALVEEHFSGFGQGYLVQHVSAIMRRHIDMCLEKTEERLAWLLTLERSPIVMNTCMYDSYRAKFFTYYKDARQKYNYADVVEAIEQHKKSPTKLRQTSQRSSTVQPFQVGTDAVSRALAALEDVGLKSLQPEDIMKLLPPDLMDMALGIMADVRAYFQNEYKGILHDVPLAIDAELIRGTGRGIFRLLRAQLALDSEKGRRLCKQLASESPQVSEQRVVLQKRLKRLENASVELLKFRVR